MHGEFFVATIRKNCDNLILVGTNNWSQDVDDVIGNELDASNIMYVLHFYASSSYHQDNLKDKFKKAVNERNHEEAERLLKAFEIIREE